MIRHENEHDLERDEHRVRNDLFGEAEVHRLAEEETREEEVLCDEVVAHDALGRVVALSLCGSLREEGERPARDDGLDLASQRHGPKERAVRPPNDLEVAHGDELDEVNQAPQTMELEPLAPEEYMRGRVDKRERCEGHLVQRVAHYETCVRKFRRVYSSGGREALFAT